MTLRERIEAIRAKYEAAMHASTGGDDSTEAAAALDALDAVLAVVVEREREQRDETYASGFADGRVAGIKEWDARLRERIEALPTTRDGADSAAKYPRSAWDFRRDVLGVFDDES